MRDLHTLLAKESPLKWLFCGASITHGAVHTFGARDYTEHFAERVRRELMRQLDAVINTAISGNTSNDILKEFDQRITVYSPDVVFLMIGGNDSAPEKNISIEQYEANLETIRQRIEAGGGIVVYQTSCPILPDGREERAAQVAAFMEAMRRVASRRGSLLIDHEKAWRTYAGKHQFWMNDSFHPNRFGHRFMAQVLLQELGIFDLKSPTCMLSFPGCEIFWSDYANQEDRT